MCKNLFLLWSLVIALTYPEIASADKTTEDTLNVQESTKLESIEEYPASCKDVLDQGHTDSDFYVIQPKNAPEPFLVLCNMDSLGGGWTTILNRFDGSQDFYLNFTSYKTGFGNLGGEFWLGLDKLFYMTGYSVNEVLFEFMDWEELEADAHYDHFGIGSEDVGYILELVEGFSGSAGDSLTFSAGMKFTTADNDQDVWNTNCAVNFHGAWWYRNCTHSNPTGKYYEGGTATTEYPMYWGSWHGDSYGLKELRMMIRPRGWK